MQTRLVMAMALAIGAFTPGFAQDDLQERVERLEETVGQQADLIEQLQGSKGGLPDNGLWGLWRNGFRLDSPDGKFQLKVGGRVQNDWAVFKSNRRLNAAAGRAEDGTEFRRARIRLQAKIHKRFIAKFQYDLEDGVADFKDVYVGVTDLPFVGTFTVGHQREPFGLENQTSSLHLTFMERSLPAVFTPGRNTGMRVSNYCESERFTYSYGVFRESNSFGEDQSNGDYNVAGRITGLPMYDADSGNLVHVGVSYSYRNGDGNAWRYRSRPEVHLANNVVDTGGFLTNGVHTYGAEAACVFGPLSVQGEYYHADAEDPRTTAGASAGNGVFHGHYISASYFLTGESRPYKTKTGTFDRVKPKKNLFEEDGCGAWAIAFRYSTLDLSSGPIMGGKVTDLSAGVNWYMNPNARVTLNYVNTDLERGARGDMLAWRFQLDF